MNLFLGLFSARVAYASVDTFMNSVGELIINPLINFLFALAVVYFLYGVFEFLSNQENEDKRTAGKSHMLWGIVGITIMMGVWIIFGLILDTFNLRGDIDVSSGGVINVKLPPYNP